MVLPRRRARVWVPSVFIMAGWALPISLARAAPPASNPATQAKLRFPTYGVALDAPAGWTRVPEGGPGHVARWALVDQARKSAKAFLVVEVFPGGKGDLDTHARSLARKAGARVLQAGKTLGGQRTLSLATPGRLAGMRPRYALVGARGSHIYVLGVIAPTSDAAAAVLEPVRRSWTWIKTERPEGHLRLMPKPVAIFENLVTMRFPELARPVGGRSAQKMSLHIYDCVAGKPAMVIEIDRIPKNPGMPAEQWMSALARLLADRLGLDKPPTVSKRLDGPFRVIFDPLPAPLPKEMMPGNGPGPTVRYAMIVPNDQTVLSLTFFVPPNTKQATQAYYALAERMLASAALPGSDKPGGAAPGSPDRAGPDPKPARKLPGR